MQLPILIPRGQAKPFGSVPRINWAHPLTTGLIFYGYTLPLNNVVDLISGAMGARIGSGTLDPVKPTKFGTSTAYTNNALIANGTGHRIASSSVLSNFYTSGKRYSYATSFLATAFSATNISVALTVGVTSANTPIYVGADTSSNAIFGFGNANGAPVTALALNVYTSLVGVVTGATSQACYVNANAALATAVTSTEATTTSPVNFHTDGSGTAGAMTIYYGAIWNRTLSAQEALQLYLDPYCFLIYPEDEIFAELVGVTVNPGTNVFAAGATLPMMGVG